MTKRLLMLSLCFLSLIAKAQGNELFSLSMKNVSLKDILKEIEKQTDYSFVYNETLDLSMLMSIYIKDKTLNYTLQGIFNGTGIEWKISGKHIILQKTPKNVRISGYIIDQQTGESLIGASISESGTFRGTITNDYGYFSLSIPQGVQQLRISYVGYQPLELPITVDKDTLLSFKLEPWIWLKEVVVEAPHYKSFSPSAGAIEFSMQDIQNTPAVFGETDIMKTLQLLPGVQSGVEGAAGVYVRGGGPDQNLTLLDGVNVYNTNHFFGLFSIFNGDAVKKVTLYKGSFPARFGGRLSSVIDTRLRDGDMQAYHGSFSIGFLSSRLNFEGPLIKDKTSFNISARRSYVDGFLRVADMIIDETVPIIYFYDFNAKLNHKFSDKSRLYLSFYNGKDKMGTKTTDYQYDYVRNDINYQWGNTIGSLRWNYVFNNKLFANATVAYNNYNFDFKSTSRYQQNSTSMESNTLPYSYNYTNFQYSGIEDWSGNVDFEYQPNNKHYIRFGGGYIYHTFKPEVHGNKQYEEEDGKEIKNINHSFLSENINAQETSIYMEDEIMLTNKWKTNIGLHFSTFSVQDKTYSSLQPRLSLGYELNRNLSFKTSYTEMSQYIHLLTSTSLSQPTDLWVPVTSNLAPMLSHQTTLGAFYLHL